MEVFKKSIVWFLSIINVLRKKISGSKKNNPKSVVVLSLHKLGDSVFTIPAIKNIIDFHNDNVYIICFPETLDIYKLKFDQVEYVVIPRNSFFFREMIAKSSVRKLVNSLKPLIIYDLTGSIRSASIIFNSQSDEIVGTNKNIYGKFYSKFTPLRKTPHSTDIYLDVIKLKIKSFSFDNQINLKYDFKNKYILLHPFAGWQAKEWNLNKFIRLAQLLSIKKNTCAIIFPSVKNISSDILEDIESKAIKVIFSRSTKDLIEHISKSSLLIGNDSGPIHIANLLGVPTFTIYGPTNPDFHKPIVGLNGFQQKHLCCSPSNTEKVCFTNAGRYGCPAFNCMDLLSVEEVFNELSKFIKEINSKYSIWSNNARN
jgi:heptosyltransferase-2